MATTVKSLKAEGYPYNLIDDIFDIKRIHKKIISSEYKDVFTNLSDSQIDALEYVIESLSEIQQYIILNRYKYYKTTTEIASKLDCSSGYVNDTIHKILRKFRHPPYSRMIINGIDRYEVEKRDNIYKYLRIPLCGIKLIDGNINEEARNASLKLASESVLNIKIM